MELYVVADGMGGHEGGEVASDLTLSALQRHLDEYSHIDWNIMWPCVARLLRLSTK
jgi:serine/threonine protein phosphatase PrpC